MKRYLLLALFLAVIQYSQGQSSKKSYTNPICTEDGKALHVADPFIYEHEGTYYLTGTPTSTWDSITTPRTIW